ncbi:hypothetical protein OIE52_19400 [Streptomyces canus]|nr:hypothetical protein [Streptomyces canus]
MPRLRRQATRSPIVGFIVSLAEEHRTQSDWHRNASEQARGYADLLNDHS